MLYYKLLAFGGNVTYDFQPKSTSRHSITPVSYTHLENLILTDDRDVQWTDSVLALIREKDTNTIKMMRTLSEANDSMVSTSDIEQIIAQQDSVVTHQRVQHRRCV